MVAAKCESAKEATDLQEDIWSFDEIPDNSEIILMASCSQLNVQNATSQIALRDCVNGTLMPRKYLPKSEASYTEIHRVFRELGKHFPLDIRGEKIPFENDITIYNRTKVSGNFQDKRKMQLPILWFQKRSQGCVMQLGCSRK